MLTIHSDRDFNLIEIANLVRCVELAEKDTLYYPRILISEGKLSDTYQLLHHLYFIGEKTNGNYYYLQIKKIDSNSISIYDLINIKPIELEFLQAFHVHSWQSVKCFYLKYKRELLNIYTENNH